MKSPLSEDPPPPTVGRLSSEFVLKFLTDVAAMCRGDFLDAVISVAILDANLGQFTVDESGAAVFAAFDAAAPDDLRRPVSINAIASSLGLPFETVRRRIHRMSQHDLCRLVPEGVIVPESLARSDYVRDMFERNYERLGDLYRDLREMAPSVEMVVGLDGPAPGAEALEPAPIRLVARSTANYVLRYLEFGRPVAGDFVSSIVFLAIAVGNVGHITHSAEASRRFATPRTVVPNSERRRISVKALAITTGLPFETTRRRVNGLIELGLCQRDHEGIFIDAETLLSPPLTKLRAVNVAGLQRLFTGLARMGVRFD